MAIEARVYEDRRLVQTLEVAGPLELGRQRDGEAGAGSRQLIGGTCRLVIAPRDDVSVPRTHALVEPRPSGKVCVHNKSSTLPILLADGTAVPPGGTRDLDLPAVMTLGTRVVRLQETEAPAGFHSLPEATRPPGCIEMRPLSGSSLEFPRDSRLEAGRVLGWLREAMEVLQVAASSADFFQKAARAVVEVVGLDAGRVLLLEEGRWRLEAFAAAPEQSGPPPRESRQVLARVAEERRSFWEDPGALGSESLADVGAVVASPILDPSGQVLGALYGDRRVVPGDRPRRIDEVEARLVELLACGVAAGLARLKQERAALAARIKLEQFFTPEIARELESNPDLLAGQDRLVTVLFCDIRDFSRISERLGPAATVEWIGSVLDSLSECILAHRGVLTDYLGDEVMAMWGAPGDEPDHAGLAARAALDMLARLPALNERWEGVLGRRLDVGIGINTGLTRVGNVGSRYKFKYGPLGNTVNVAHRVCGAGKYFGCRILMTAATRGLLAPSFECRRLCAVSAVNLEEPLELYEVVPAGPDWPRLRAGYERALDAFDGCRYDEAAAILRELVAVCPGDGPSRLLLTRTEEAIGSRAGSFDPVFKLPGK